VSDGVSPCPSKSATEKFRSKFRILKRRIVNLVKVADDFVEQANALDAVSTYSILTTKIPEFGNRRKHDDNGVVRLVVQILTQKQRRFTFECHFQLIDLLLIYSNFIFNCCIHFDI